MAKLSAWLAVLAAAAIVISLAMQSAALEFGAFGPAAAAVLLGMGAYRTLRAMSGGLRLLCGAWGVSTGLAWYAPSYNFPDFVPGMLAIGAPVLVSAIGLALVVLHREKKSAA
ncbi:MAG TPA: hypothetical protein VEA80_19460 [Vitreimonas sp.]|uniref:hypothetical protein n=1 Tax=Vitreimonas sp. TaxID=3069702 RepID=UPI002D54D965|nr:hypothetical protein [Vitreimonas sp.]HYD89668.1 hypothetical protein [Vitreimonas sp.]